MNTLNILFVDDDPADIAILRDFFEDAPFSFTLEEKHTGEEALARLKNGDPPDLLLLDFNMPGMSGLQLLQAIRREAKLTNIPIIVLTTSERDEDIEATFNSKANHFVTKPQDVQGFNELIKLINDFATAYIWNAT